MLRAKMVHLKAGENIVLLFCIKLTDVLIVCDGNVSVSNETTEQSIFLIECRERPVIKGQITELQSRLSQQEVYSIFSPKVR
jgi:hypothetical protein